MAGRRSRWPVPQLNAILAEGQLRRTEVPTESSFAARSLRQTLYTRRSYLGCTPVTITVEGNVVIVQPRETNALC